MIAALTKALRAIEETVRRQTAMAADDAEYERRKPLIELAVRELDQRLRSILKSLGDRLLVRASMTPSRVKELRSLKRKAKRKSWTLPEALDKATDLVGCRVVCNNLQDVERAADLLEQRLKKNGMSVKRQDHLATPKEGGYRAIHLDIRLPVQFGREKMKVGCEVQVRTLLQDAWAQLTHADVYKEKQPKELRQRAERLSELLAVADKIAEDIRSEIAKPQKGRRPRAGAPLDKSALAFLYYRAFGSEAPDYALELVAQDLATTRVRADGLDSLLHDEDLRTQLHSAYREQTRWDPDSIVLFRWIVRAAVEGRDAAVELARGDGRSDWQEVKTIARSEARSGLPDTWQELVERIEYRAEDDDSGSDVMRWADGFDSITSCMCGTSIVQADSLAENLVEHYGLSGKEAEDACEKIEQVITNSGVETGSWDDSSMCSACGQSMSCDD